MNTRLLITTAALALLLGGSLDAAETDDVPVLKLRYEARDLVQPERARVLYQRLRASAAQVCAGHDGQQLAMRLRYASCRRSALDGAVRALRSPLINALHHGQHPSAVARADAPR
jgi:UrcA family protein